MIGFIVIVNRVIVSASHYTLITTVGLVASISYL